MRQRLGQACHADVASDATACTGGSYGVTTGNRMSADANWSYSYDSNGNLTKKSAGSLSTTWKYDWSANGQLIEAQKWSEDPDVTGTAVLQLDADYIYDAFGNRIQKVVDNDGSGAGAPVTMQFAFDGWNPAKPDPIGIENFQIWAQFTAGSLTTRNVHGDTVDQILGRIDVGSPNKTYWILQDRLGSVRDVIDNAAVLKDSIQYSGFGVINLGTELNPTFRGIFTFAGGKYDTETDFILFGVRYFGPGMGRFISQDPMGFDAGDANLYRYVGNNPVGRVDPSGLHWLETTADYVLDISAITFDLNPMFGYANPVRAYQNDDLRYLLPGGTYTVAVWDHFAGPVIHGDFDGASRGAQSFFDFISWSAPIPLPNGRGIASSLFDDGRSRWEFIFYLDSRLGQLYDQYRTNRDLGDSFATAG